MSFYSFDQNNSGGRFHFDYSKGISVCVVIEADGYREANRKAEDIGLYFDSVGDCHCCGRRWSEQYDDADGHEVPRQYGFGGLDDDFTKESTDHRSREETGTSSPYTYAFVHYKDGRVIGYENPRGKGKY